MQHSQWEVEQAIKNCGEEIGTPRKIGTASFKISLSVLYFEFSSKVKKKAPLLCQKSNEPYTLPDLCMAIQKEDVLAFWKIIQTIV